MVAIALASLDLDRVRGLLRLIAEANEIPERDPERPQHLVTGLVHLLGATVGGCVTECDFVPEGRGAFAAIFLCGWDSTTLPVLTSLAEKGSAFNPGLRALMHAGKVETGHTVTATRHALVDDRTWYASPYVDDYIVPAHLDHALFSTKRGAIPSIVHGMGFYRSRNERPFDEQDRDLLHLFHSECDQMLRASASAADSLLLAQLSPRERHTFDLLLAGLADKEIADRLGISPHTVNQYTKSIYRRFGVHSRAALLARRIGRSDSLVSGNRR
jgi:DNA-binding CsgD family transcriptional regulator